MARTPSPLATSPVCLDQQPRHPPVVPAVVRRGHASRRTSLPPETLRAVTPIALEGQSARHRSASAEFGLRPHLNARGLAPDAAGGPGNAVSPLSFPPLETPFPGYAAPRGRGVIPPFFKEHGQRGQTAGGNSTAAFSGADGRRGDPFPRACRAPPPFGLPDATPPLSPLCAFRPQGRGALVRPSPAAAVHVLARCRPSVERRLSSRASGCKCSPESRLHNSPYSYAAACRCKAIVTPPLR